MLAQNARAAKAAISQKLTVSARNNASASEANVEADNPSPWCGPNSCSAGSFGIASLMVEVERQHAAHQCYPQ